MSHVTRTPLSRSKGQRSPGRFDHVGASGDAAVSVGTYWPWERTATLPSADAVGSAARGISAPTERTEMRGHIVAAARLQLLFMATALQLHYKSPYATRCITLYIMQ